MAWAKRGFLVGVGLALLGVGCGPPQETVERELEMLKREMASMHARQQHAAPTPPPARAPARARPAYPPSDRAPAARSHAYPGLPLVKLDPLRTDPFDGRSEPPIRLGTRGRAAPPAAPPSVAPPLEYDHIDSQGNLVGADGQVIYQAGIHSDPIDTLDDEGIPDRLYEDPHESPAAKVRRGTQVARVPRPSDRFDLERGHHGPGIVGLDDGRLLARASSPRLQQFPIEDHGAPIGRGPAIRVQDDGRRGYGEPPVHVRRPARAQPAPPPAAVLPPPPVVAPALAPVRSVQPEAKEPAKTFPPPVHAPGPQKLLTQRNYKGAKQRQVKSIYSLGMKQFHAGQYKASVKTFGRVLLKFPDHELADNSLYWLGETAYAQDNYRQALMWFQDVILRYPEGNKLPDAMLKSALCYARLGDTSYARKMLAEVETLFQPAPVAKVARERRLALGPEGDG